MMSTGKQTIPMSKSEAENRSPFPQLFVIGAAKAGTTSLYHYCNQHPHIFMSPIKETNFFARPSKRFSSPVKNIDEAKFPIKSLQQYQSLFAEAGDARVCGEASPLYLETPQTARRIKEQNPSAKFVAILRDPVDRAYSDYLMGRRYGEYKGGLNDAMQWNSHFVQVGRYAHNLRPFLKEFPRKNFRFFRYENLKSDPAGMMRELYQFLDVDPTFTPDFSVAHNPGGTPRSSTVNRLLINQALRRTFRRMSPAWLRELRLLLVKRNLGPAPDLPTSIRNELREYYKDDIQELEKILETDLSDWLE